MYMLLIGDVVLIESVDVHGLFAVTGAKKLYEVAFEVIAVLLDEFLWICADHLHVPYATAS
jgi:hypothetical protein